MNSQSEDKRMRQFSGCALGQSTAFHFRRQGGTEWIFTGTKKDGARVEVTGCDLFTFKDGKIAIKNSYRKNRSPLK